MPTTTTEHSGAADAALVASALAGDRSALADIYDTYADRIHTMCVHMLGDRDEGADACGEVFLVAFQRLDGLRDHTKLRPWLYAIARHEVYRRTKRRSRITLTEEVNEMEYSRHHDIGSGSDTDDAADAAAVAVLVREAALGLDDRDRMVLELQLQGLDGAELAAALGTSTSTSYQHVHRMRERMERSLGALLVARQGRKECDDLDRLLSGWDGTFSVLWRKRVARHVDSCATCERRRKAVPATLLGTAGASPLAVTPTSVRDRVLGDAVVGGGAASGAGGRGWQRDGFPPADADRPRGLLLAVSAIVGILLLLGGLVTWAPWDDPIDVATRRVVVSPTSTASPESTTSTSLAPDVTTTAPGVSEPTTTVPEVLPPTSPPTTVAPPTTRRPTVTVAPTPTTRPAPTTTVAVTTTAPTTTTTSTTTTTAPPPVVRLTGPTVLYARAQNGAVCSNEVHAATVSPTTATPVTLRWTAGAATGTVAMTRNRLRTRWTATIDVPFGTTGVVTAYADAVSGGTTGSSNAAIAQIAPCPVIG